MNGVPVECSQGHLFPSEIDHGFEEWPGIITYIKLCPICGGFTEFTSDKILPTAMGINRLDKSHIKGSRE